MKQDMMTKVAMSKTMGKILDSKVGKGMVGVGNAVKSGINKVGTKIGKDLFGSKEIDAKQKADAEKLNSEYSGFKYGVQIKKKNK